MRRKALHVVGDPVRLNSSLDIIRRKVWALRAQAADPAADPATDPVALVFNRAEIQVLERLARGERVVGVDLTKEEAEKELLWISLGGEYSDDPELEDQDDRA